MRNSPLDICIVGAGPRGLAVAERVRANAGLSGAPPVTLHIVDPCAGEGGKVWRMSQPRDLLMNTVASQVTMFTDASVELDGPVCPGPSLYDWARGLSADDGPPWLLEEAAGLHPDHYPTRAAYGRYLAWFFDDLARLPGDHLKVVVHQRTAVALHDDPDGAQTVVLDDGARLAGLSAVVLAQGHIDMPLSGDGAALSSYARTHGLGYVPPGNPADADLSFVQAGERVAIRGLGLNFFDHMTLLTSGRGGRFEHVAGRLVYQPGGQEPVIYAGSRRGIPHHARGRNQKGATGRHLPLFLTQRVIEELQARRTLGAPADFRHDVWPLVRREVEVVYYTALVKQRRGQAAADAFARAYAAEAVSKTDHLAAHGVDATDIWDWELVARPYRKATLANSVGFRHWLLEYLRLDVERAERGNLDDPVKAALDVLRDLRNEIRLVVDHGGVSGSSYRDDIEKWFTPLNAFASIGPPASRIKEMIALMEAGVLHMVGPDMRVDPQPGGQGFQVGSELIADSGVTVTTLIDARMPAVDVRTTTDPLLRGLLAEGKCRPYRIDDTRHGHYEGGGLAVTARPYQIVDVHGRAHRRRFAFGLPTEGVHWATAAGIRPGVNSVILADADAIARACLSVPSAPPVTRVPPVRTLPLRNRGSR